MHGALVYLISQAEIIPLLIELTEDVACKVIDFGIINLKLSHSFYTLRKIF